MSRLPIDREARGGGAAAGRLLRSAPILLLVLAALGGGVARAAEGAAHEDPIAGVALALAVFLVAAKLGGELATRLGQPAVLGELLAGVALGNLDLLGVGLFEPMQADPAVNVLE